MKRFLFAIVWLFASSFLMAQTYQYSAFPKQQGVWHYTEYSDNWTIIGGTNLNFTYNSTTGLMSGDGRYFEDNKQIYLIEGNDTTLKYDFNLTVGDTIIANATFGIDTFYVAFDDSTGYYGRRQITLLTNSPYYLPTEWVEGIGNISGYGMLWNNFSAFSISGGHRFWCMYGDSATIPCNSALGGLESEERTTLKTYPNPTSGIISINYSAADFDAFRLYNQLGQTMLSGQIQTQIDISNLPKGVYFLHISGKKKSVVEKVIKRE